MLLDPERTAFLRPSALMYELLVLQDIARSGLVAPARNPEHEFVTTLLQGSIARMTEAGWIASRQENGETVHRITPTGERHLRLLLVDYVQELIALYGKACDVFRQRLASFYMDGVRRVAFYPIGETAEVVYRALEGTGLTLVAAIDDDSLRWNAPFHEVSIQPPETLRKSVADGVVLTTCAFQAQVLRRVESLGLTKLRVLSL